MTNNFLSFTIIILLAASINAQTGWFQQYYGNATPYNSVFFIDDNTGWISTGKGVGQGYQGEVLKSTNGGNDWSITYTNNINFTDIYFINPLSGWITGLRRENFIYTRPILKTTDGGISFTVQHTDTTSYAPLKIQFVNSSTGFVLTNSFNLLKTTNSGLIWQTYSTNSIFSIIDGLFTSADTGWTACSVNSILKSTNGGLNWFSVHSGGKIFWKSLSFINNQTGWVTDGSSLSYTSNGGSTWNYIQSGGNRTIKFINNLTGWNCGWYQSAYINKTTNGGSNWVTQTPVFFNNFIFTDLFFLNQNTGWAVGYHSISPNYYSMILKTTNGGFTNIKNISTEIPSSFKLYQNYPNPFNPDTRIKFNIPLSNQGNDPEVKLIIYDILGKETEVLINENLNPGTYEVEWNATNYPSGVYYYKFTANNYTETRKIILIK